MNNYVQNPVAPFQWKYLFGNNYIYGSTKRPYEKKSFKKSMADKLKSFVEWKVSILNASTFPIAKWVRFSLDMDNRVW